LSPHWIVDLPHQAKKTTSPESHRQITSSFTGPALRRLFRSSTAADNRKSDHCDKNDSQFQLVHHAYSPSPGMGWHQVLRSNPVSLAICSHPSRGAPKADLTEEASCLAGATHLSSALVFISNIQNQRHPRPEG
jgi:hypothetical protein